MQNVILPVHKLLSSAQEKLPVDSQLKLPVEPEYISQVQL